MKTNMLYKMITLVTFLISTNTYGQSDLIVLGQQTLPNQKGINIGINVGYDLPNFTDSYTYYQVARGPKFGIDLGYNFPNGIGIGLDYDYIFNNTESSINGNIIYDTLSLSSATFLTDKVDITRHFIGLGPQYSKTFGKLGLQVYGRFGIGLIKGGDMVGYATNPTTNSIDYHLLFTGYDGPELSYKLGGKLFYNIVGNLDLSLGLYHMRYFSVTPDRLVDINNIGNVGLIYGASPLEPSGSDHLLLNQDANVVSEANCSACSSSGIELGVRYRFGAKVKAPKDVGCKDCECPNDHHKVVVTVEDGPSGKIIPNADVAIKDIDGNIIASGTTNSFGVVDFGAIPHGNYVINGKVLDIETSSGSLMEDEFLPGAVIQKKIKYEDLRFILKGRTINNRTQASESNVVVNLTNQSTRKVQQNSSDGKGEFAFRLDKNSSYEVVGIKENRLSDIDRASTIGLTRSTTLFVELKLGMDNFDCGQGTVLDIKYEYDKDALLPESKFELDRLVRYMSDHQVSRIEMSSHTDSRGSKEYNQDLSQRRAQSAVNYIMSRGVDRNRIIAYGYGENRLLNHCSDGVTCSEEDHRINRRTEAKLLCN